MVFYRRNENFVPERWLWEPSINWGNHTNLTDELGNKGSRSVMLAAMRILFILGIRHLFIVGADFRMDRDKDNYAFPQSRNKGSVNSNNTTYKILNLRFNALLPHFEKAGFCVHNCTPNSGLTAFPTMAYEDAIKFATSEMPEHECTAGLYNRLADPAAAEREHQKEVERNTIAAKPQEGKQ
jgi:hypothetical protein